MRDMTRHPEYFPQTIPEDIELLLAIVKIVILPWSIELPRAKIARRRVIPA